MKQEVLDFFEGRISKEELAEMIPQAEAVQETVSMRPPPMTGVEPYDGPWTAEQAAHLLRRTTYGPSKSMIDTAVENGMEWTVNHLLRDMALPEPPIVYIEDRDSVPVGSTWVDAPFNRIAYPLQLAHRFRSFAAHHIGQMLKSDFSAREKMSLFWMNHFSIQTSVVRDARYLHTYANTIRENCFGNYRELVKMITIDPTMLRFLNGNQNSVGSPNENYARELLELFSIGKGPQVGEGDYTTYTEDDVKELARVLTGWRENAYFTSDADREIAGFFVRGRHDRDTKQLSHRFDNVVIENMDEEEYAHAIDGILPYQPDRPKEDHRQPDKCLFRAVGHYWHVYGYH